MSVERSGRHSGRSWALGRKPAMTSTQVARDTRVAERAGGGGGGHTTSPSAPPPRAPAPTTPPARPPAPIPPPPVPPAGPPTAKRVAATAARGGPGMASGSNGAVLDGAASPASRNSSSVGGSDRGAGTTRTD